MPNLEESPLPSLHLVLRKPVVTTFSDLEAYIINKSVIIKLWKIIKLLSLSFGSLFLWNGKRPENPDNNNNCFCCVMYQTVHQKMLEYLPVCVND